MKTGMKTEQGQQGRGGDNLVKDSYASSSRYFQLSGAPFRAILCFVGGPLRMLYAAIFEEGTHLRQFVAPTSYAPPAIPPPARLSALPPASASPASSWKQRPQTAEIFQPPSVTDHTTRLLEKTDPESE